MRDDYKIGETVLIWLSGHDGEMEEGKVVAILDLPDWIHRNYVIELETAMDPLLEVRSALGMRDLVSGNSYDDIQELLADLWLHFRTTDDPILRKMVERGRALIPDPMSEGKQP